MEYLSERCVLFRYYAGDAASEIEDHFNRALKDKGMYHHPQVELRVEEAEIVWSCFTGQYSIVYRKQFIGLIFMS